MASTADIRNGVVLNMDGQLWTVIEFQHVKPGKGGAFVRTKVKNVVTGKIVDRTFNAGAKIETEIVDRRDIPVPVQRRRRLRVHGRRRLRPDHHPAADRRRRRELHAGEPERHHRAAQRRRRSTSNCRHPSYSRSPTPSRACRATAPPAARSRPRSRPATRSRCRCSSSRAPRSRSTLVRAITSAA